MHSGGDPALRRPAWLVVVLLAGICASAGAADTLKSALESAFQLAQSRQLKAARQRFEEVLRSAREQQDVWAHAEARRGLGNVLNYMASYPAARAELEQSLQLFLQLGDHSALGKVYDHLGFNSWGVGDRKQAAEFYRRAMAEYDLVGPAAGKDRATVLYNRLLAVWCGLR